MIGYCAYGKKMKLHINGYPFTKDTTKHGWIYWRCNGHRKSGFVLQRGLYFPGRWLTFIDCSVHVPFSDAVRVLDQNYTMMDLNT